MPLKVTIVLGANTFSAEGDFVFDEGFLGVFRSWVNAQHEAGGEIDALTERLKAANDAEAATVTANTPVA